MFKPALKLIVRLLPLTAAMVASVAIGASTQAQEAPEAFSFTSAAHRGSPMVALQTLPHIEATPAAQIFDVPLIARTEALDLVATAYPVEVLDAALASPAPEAASRTHLQRSFELPRPDRWTSLLATLALGAFFFIRRIV